MHRPGSLTGGISMNLKQKMVIVIMDILLLIELGICIYFGNQNQEYITAIFLRSFLPAVILTVITARLFIKKYRNINE